MKIFAEVFEDRRMLRGDGRKIVECLIYARGEAGRGDIVAQDAAIGDLGEEAGLRNKLVEKVGDVLLALGSEGLLIARAAAKGDDDDFTLLCDSLTVQEWAGSEERGAERKARRVPQKFTPGSSEDSGDFARIGGDPG